MFDHKHYIPILTAKRGEYRALRDLKHDVISALTPMFEIPPIEWDFENEEPKETVSQLVGDVAEMIETHWGRRAGFVDLFHVSESGLMTDGTHPLSHVFNECRHRSLLLTPVTGLERNDEYQAATKGVISSDRRGVCLRITSEQFSRISNIDAALESLMEALGVSRSECDLIIDFGPMDSTYLTTYRYASTRIISSLAWIGDWRSLALSGSSFPQNMSDMPPDNVSKVFRGEWDTWKHVISQDVPRKPTFSDYAIGGPEYAELDWRIIKRTANIRYAHNEAWIIVKGHVIAKNSPSQMPGLAQRLVSLDEYCGAPFSWGDQYAYDCAHGVDGPGSATTWRQVGTNHHVTFVVRQLANFPWP